MSQRGPNQGYADVFVDGAYRGRYDGYFGAYTAGRQIVWEEKGLPFGSHTIQVVVVGAHNANSSDSYIVLDTVASEQ